MTRKEHILDAVSRAGVVRIRTIANNPLWLCALVVPISFVAALIALSFGERVFAWLFVGAAFLALLFAIGFMSYFARVDPNRLQSEEYQLEQRRLTLQSKEDPEPRAITAEPVSEDTEAPQISRGD